MRISDMEHGKMNKTKQKKNNSFSWNIFEEIYCVLYLKCKTFKKKPFEWLHYTWRCIK